MSSRRHTPVIPPHISHDSCTPGLRRELIRENPLFWELSAAEIDQINEQFIDQGFDADETILREGEPANRLYVVALGIVKLFRSTDTGASSLIDVLSSGDYFGSLPAYGPKEYEETAVAKSTVCALSVDSETFRRIIEKHPSVGLQTIDALSNRLSLAHEMVTQLRGYDAEARTAYVLLRLATKLGQEWEGSTLIRSPLSREEIAAMAGTTTETCSRVLTALRRRGVIEAGREWVAIADWEALRSIAPGSSG